MKIEVGKKYVDNRGRIVNITDERGGWYLGVSGQTQTLVYSVNGSAPHLKGCMDLVKEYTEPKTQDVWVVWYLDCDGYPGYSVCYSKVDSRTIDEYTNCGDSILAIKKVTLTEGEFDNE